MAEEGYKFAVVVADHALRLAGAGVGDLKHGGPVVIAAQAEVVAADAIGRNARVLFGRADRGVAVEQLPLQKIVQVHHAAALDLIVYLTRFPDGTRKVTQTSEVAGMESEVITLTDIFQFQQTGTDAEGKPVGQFRPTGLRPMFAPKLEAAGYKLDRAMFMAR